MISLVKLILLKPSITNPSCRSTVQGLGSSHAVFVVYVTLKRFKVYSVIQVFWSLWDSRFRQCSSRFRVT